MANTKRGSDGPTHGLGPEAGGQSGDTEGLSEEESVDSESVEELVEEGQAFEAGIISGVEDAPNADEGGVRTRQVPVDDVPPEYLDEAESRRTLRLGLAETLTRAAGLLGAPSSWARTTKLVRLALAFLLHGARIDR